MTDRHERPNIIPWPPMVLATALIAGIALGYLFPLPWAAGIARDILTGVGVMFVIAALALYLLSFNEMRKHRTAILPTSAASHLVTGGPYAFTRNPIYLANLILLIGLGLAISNPWLLIAAPIAGFAEQKLGIEREEAHLEARFGKAFREYRRKVRRWI
jgi:protein-S-isoprenylcysteine O-methyltransferase Ste14